MSEGSDVSQPPKPTPETPTQKLERLSQALGVDKINQRIDELNQTQNRILQELGNTNQNLNSALEWIRDFSNKVNQAGGIPQQQQTTQQTQNMANTLQQLPPEMKANLISSASDALSRLVQAWKGSTPQGPDPMAEMGKQLMQDLFRATVDDIQQRVYGIRKIPPQSALSHQLE